MPTEQSSENEDINIIEENPGYNPKSEYSKPNLIMEAMRNCSSKRSNEMIKGYWNTKISKDGLPIKTWISDARKQFISSVMALKGQLDPEIKREPHYKKFFEDIKIKEKELFFKYSYPEEELVMVNQRYIWRKTGNQIMPEIDEIIIMPDNKNPTVGKPNTGYWNSKVNAYWNKMLELYDGAYAELNCLIDKLDYFKPKMRWG